MIKKSLTYGRPGGACSDSWEGTILFNSSNPKRIAFLRLVLLSAAFAAAAGFIWNALCKEGRASNPPKEYRTVSIFGEAAGAAAAAAANGGSMSTGGGPLGGNNNGGSNVPGSTKDGLPIKPKVSTGTKPISLIPDASPAPVNPPPVDLSLISGPTNEPQRRPLINPALAGSFPNGGGQITGWAGVFVP